jgi:putative tryptophan/tyrosine transport system substrate-binding protein
MRRREFIALLGGAAAAWPLAARAQPSAKTYRIGFLGVTSYAEYRYLVDALRMGLRQLGYEEGKNIAIEYRWAEGRFDRLPVLAAELVKLNIEVLVTHSTAGALAAKRATSTIPIVMAAGADPVATGLVASLNRPGGNLTGSMQFWTEVAAKRVELIKEAIPALTSVAVFVQSGAPATHITLTAMERIADALRVELIPIELKTRDDIAASISGAAARPPLALVLMEGPLITRKQGGAGLPAGATESRIHRRTQFDDGMALSQWRL